MVGVNEPHVFLVVIIVYLYVLVADKSNVSDKENPCSSVSELNDARDYQLAQMLERQDRENLKYKKIMGKNHIY